MALRFLKCRQTCAGVCRTWIAYGEHLLGQPATLRKRQLMRYFALGFFHDGELFDMNYSPKEESLTIIMHSAEAVDHATRLARERLVRRGIWSREAEESEWAKIDLADFRHRITFKGVRCLEMRTKRHRWGATFATYDTGELSDADSDDLPQGYSWLRAVFHFDSFLALAFRTVHVRPLRPDRLAWYLRGSKKPVPSLLTGRDLKASLAAQVSRWRRQLRKIERAGEAKYVEELRRQWQQALRTTKG